MAIGPIAAIGAIAWLSHAKHLEFLLGLGVGAAAGAIVVLVDSPPAYIARWRLGAEGERATARTLRPLVKDGWTLLNDVPTAWGNIDHVLVGPAGVFVLETKNLSGILSVKRGVLAARWHEDPDDGYENRRLAQRVRASAADLHRALGDHGVSTWVQPVVVLWSTFEQRSVLSSGGAWIRGKDLVDVLKARPTRGDGNGVPAGRGDPRVEICDDRRHGMG